MKDHCCIICRLCVVQHGKIVDRTGLLYRIISKRHILRRQWLSICKFHIVPDRHLPGQSVFTDTVPCSQVIANGQVCIGYRQRTLDQWFVDMLSGSPSIGRVKPGFRLRAGIQGDHNRIPVSASAGTFRTFSPASQEQ